MNPVREDNAADKKNLFPKKFKLAKPGCKIAKFSNGVKRKVKIGILSLGCPRNVVDSEIILNRLYFKKYEVVDIEDCDTAIINTCSFIKEACEESIGKILDLIELKKQGRIKKIIVAGCLPGRYKSDLVSSLPEVDAFLGPQQLPEKIEVFKKSLTPAHYSYVKICEGCLNNCSYCAIPNIKPEFKSRSIESISEEVRALDSIGVREINLIGQDISQYGLDLCKKISLHKLLSKISKGLKNIEWIRLLYLHPNHITGPLIKAIAKNKKICKYIDLPLQHINDKLLRQMNRQITKSRIIKLLRLIRHEIPDVAIRTSFIVGFPGETEKQFKELSDFVSEARFERLGVFIYSREEGTKAFNFKYQVPGNIKEKRFDALMSLQQSIASEICENSIGSVKDVIIDEKCADNKDKYLGRTAHDAPEVDGSVYVNAKNLEIGDIVKVRITQALEYDLIGDKI